MKRSVIRTLLASIFVLILLTTPALAAGDTLIVASPYDAKTLDPHLTNDSGSQNAMRQIYEKLIAFDADKEVVPSLAERWEVLEEGRAYKFYLKKGVKFHNGEEMKADDVLFSLKRSLSPEASPIHAYSTYMDPDGFEKVDDHTVIVRIKKPMGAFLASMNHGYASILSEKAVGEGGRNYGMEPVGTGPFKLAKWTKGDRIVLDRFEDYHGRQPALKSIVIRAVTETTSRTIELESGAVDLALTIPGADVKRLEDNAKLEVKRVPGQELFYMAFNMDLEPWKDPRVREALSLAINREGIVKAVFRGYATPASGPWSKAVKYAPQEVPVLAYDLERAKSLMKEAGYEKGFKMTLLTYESKSATDIAAILQAEYRKIGVEVEIKLFEWGAYIETIKAEDHAPFVLAWSAGAPALDPFFFAGPKFHSGVIGSSNRARLNDPEVDALIDRGASTQDGPEREQIYLELFDKLNEIRPWVCIAVQDQLYGYRKELKGLQLGASFINFYGDAYFEE